MPFSVTSIKYPDKLPVYGVTNQATDLSREGLTKYWEQFIPSGFEAELHTPQFEAELRKPKAA